MRIVGFYVPKKRPPLKRWQKIAIAIAIAGGFYAVLFLLVPSASASANPNWGGLGKDFGSKLGGSNLFTEYQHQKMLRKGQSWELWLKEVREPAYQHARSAIIYAKESGTLSEAQQKVLVHMLDRLMREETAKTYNDVWHRAFAKIKGGLVSGKLSSLDMINIGDFVKDPYNFDWSRWTMPGTGNYSTPPQGGLWEGLMNQIRKTAPLSVGGGTPISAPGLGGNTPYLMPAEQGMIQVPAESLQPISAPGFSKGFAYLHNLPSPLEQAQMVKFDEPIVAPDWFPVWVIPILILLARALGLPL